MANLIMDDKFLNEVVQVKYGTGNEKCIALVKAYASRPTYELETDDGTHFNWMAHLCEPLPESEQTKFWRSRALKAEEKISTNNIEPAIQLSKYDELLNEVESKFPDETRHETALRYIKNCEQQENEPEEAI